MVTDFSRVRLNELKNRSNVLMQQGRVALDADENERSEIFARGLRALGVDILGPATVSSVTPDGFKITKVAGNLEIGVGRLYADGRRAECHGAVSTAAANRLFDDVLDERKFAGPVLYTAQPYLPNPPALPTSGTHLVYLLVWDRVVSHLEDPDLIEPALGVDTVVHKETVWQVRVLGQDAGADATCATPDADVLGWADVIAPSTGVLTTGTYDVAPADDPCELPPTAGYRGTQSHLYCVEIHNPGQPGVGGATFKWTRNRGIGSRVSSLVSLGEVEVESLGRDDILSIKTNDWVEFIDDRREFAGLAGEMRKVTVHPATRRLTFSPNLPATMASGPFPNSAGPKAGNLRVNLWNERGKIFQTSAGGPVFVEDLDTATTGVIAVPAPSVELILEHGLTVRFDSTGAKGFRTGDRWYFAARPGFPVEPLDRAPPRETHFSHARLAMVNFATGEVADCRHKWPPAGHDCSCTACVTEESHLSGQLTIQAAVDKVKPTGGTVCLGPGKYELQAPVRIDGATSARVRGQGPASLIVAAAGGFEISDSIATSIENLAIVSAGERPLIVVDTALGVSLTKLVLATFGRGGGEAIALRGVVAAATISENVIFADTGIVAHTTKSFDPTTASGGGDFSVLILAATKIDDNIFLCTRSAVALDGDMFRMLNTRITGNEVLACRDVGISAVGFGLPGSSLTISANDLYVPGSGIRCCGQGIWIESNKIVKSEDERMSSTSGIDLTAGGDVNGIGQCQLLANQIGGFGAGISFDATIARAIVKQNIIENCAGGIVSTADADLIMVSIDNNQLSSIDAAPGNFTDPVIGIGVGQARSATIAGNTIRWLGQETLRTPFRAAIYTSGAARARILGNEVIDIGPTGEFAGATVGILLTMPLEDFEVDHNRVEQEEHQGSNEFGGNWWALYVGPTIPSQGQAPAPGTGTATSTGTASSSTGIAGAAAATGPAPRSSAFELGSTISINTMEVPGSIQILFPVYFFHPSGSILGNVFRARGGHPVAVTADECLFSDNRVDCARFDEAAITLWSYRAVVNANWVNGGGPSIDIAPSDATVLGNMTSGGIIHSGSILAGVWAPLNVNV